MNELKKSKLNHLTFGLLFLPLLYITYFIDREDFVSYFALYSASFLGYLLCMRQSYELNWLFVYGLVARAALIFAIPNLSDDYFRFFWDGFLTGNGMGSFAYLPSEIGSDLMQRHPESATYLSHLLQGMNSSDYYSVYPPINQWVFWFASSFGSIKLSLIALKLILFLGEIGVFVVLKKLCSRFNLSTNQIAFYWLNPLVILEIVGNCHFEGLMLFFFLSATYALGRLKTVEGGFYFALSMLSKLFVGMFLPLLFFKAFKRKKLQFVGVIALVVFVCYLPFVSIVELKQMFSSIDLYFQKFEFNASLYYVARWIGIEVSGYNQIAFVGPLLAGISLVLIAVISWLYRFKNRLSMFTGFILINSVYLLFSPIVHPWYLVVMIGLSVLSKYKSVLVWSYLISLSYYAYSNSNYQESLVLVAVEYLVFFWFLIKDIRGHFSWNKLVSGIKTV